MVAAFKLLNDYRRVERTGAVIVCNNRVLREHTNVRQR